MRAIPSHCAQRLTPLLAYALALASLALTGWAGWLLARHPEAGAAWSFRSGEVYQVDPSGPAAGLLQPGDRVLTVDGEPVGAARSFPERQASDELRLVVERGGVTRPVAVYLARPTPGVIFARLEPLLVALAFWGVGVAILVFSRPDRQGLLFFLFCQAGSATLAAGAVSAIGPAWVDRLFNLLLWWLGPLAVHFHRHFPRDCSLRPAHRLQIAAYGLAAAASAPMITADPRAWQAIWPPLAGAGRLWLALGLACVVFLVVRAYRHTAAPEARQQIRIVTLGGGMALAGFVGLSLLPDTLLGVRVPYSISFLFLPLIPLSYGYAILRYRLIALDRYVNRSAAFALVLMLLGGLCLGLYAVLARLLAPAAWQQPVAGIVITLLCTALAIPLYRRLQVAVDYVFYGGWYDYQAVVQQIGQALDLTLDTATLARTLVQRIHEAMRLDFVCLLVPEGSGLAPIGIGSQANGADWATGQRLSAAGALARHLQACFAPITTDELREALVGEELSAPEADLLNAPQAQLWLPLAGSPRSAGELIVGLKRGGEVFNPRDVEILETVARQAGIALQNARLLTELRQRVSESARLHREVLHVREEERKRVARELHDEIIQSLVGLNYGLSHLRNGHGAEMGEEVGRLQEEVRSILTDVRRICADLRPPALDSLGLVSAVRARLRMLEGLASTLVVKGDEEQELPEAVSLCLYRVLQEALLNVQKHAGATQAGVTLRIGPEEVGIVVQDDGCGFDVPSRLGVFVQGGHFGLAGLRERLDAVEGTFDVRSTPGQGTRVEARIPLTKVVEG